jgi:hypothetical protein
MRAVFGADADDQPELVDSIESRLLVAEHKRRATFDGLSA